MFLNLFDGNKDINVFPTDINLLYAYYPIVENLDNTNKKRLKRILFKEFSNNK